MLRKLYAIFYKYLCRIDSDGMEIYMKKYKDYLIQKKAEGTKVTMLTCYDYPTAVLEDAAGIDVIFVGDSVGTNMLGYTSETEVSMDDMIHHLKAVRRGVTNAYLLVDMPYKSYDTPELALRNARIFVENGADGVKLEGMQEEVIKYLVNNDIEVVGHLGLNPQFHERRAVQGKTIEEATKLIEGSIALEKCGVVALVLELVPEEIGKILSQRLAIPVIGIGAGRFCDGQVQIVNDILGIPARKYKHVKKYQNYREQTENAFRQYAAEVKDSTFLDETNVNQLAEDVYNDLLKRIANK
jgi:3-methyl-2-oxobutanoate hydroxymethyltransferase